MSDSTNELLEQRESNWGHPVDTHARIAQVWSGILGYEVTAHQVTLCMTGLKMVRASINPDDPDSLDDAAGYVEIGKRVMRGDNHDGRNVQRRGWAYHDCPDCVRDQCPGHETPPWARDEIVSLVNEMTRDH